MKYVKGMMYATGLNGRDAVRELIRKRDKYTCQVCKLVWKQGTRRLDVHHLTDEDGSLTKGYDRLEVALTPGYMITLCHKCHLNLPSERAKMVKANKERREKRQKRSMIQIKARQARLAGGDKVVVA